MAWLKDLFTKRKQDPAISIVSLLKRTKSQAVLNDVAASIGVPISPSMPANGFFVLAKEAEDELPEDLPAHVPIIEFPISDAEAAIRRAILYAKASRRLNE